MAPTSLLVDRWARAAPDPSQSWSRPGRGESRGEGRSARDQLVAAGLYGLQVDGGEEVLGLGGGEEGRDGGLGVLGGRPVDGHQVLAVGDAGGRAGEKA